MKNVCMHERLDMTVSHDWETENGYKVIRNDSFGDEYSTRILYRTCLDCGECVETGREPDYRNRN